MKTPQGFYLHGIMFLLIVIPTVVFVLFFFISTASNYFSKAQQLAYNVSLQITSNKTNVNNFYNSYTHLESSGVTGVVNNVLFLIFLIVLFTVGYMILAYVLMIRLKR